MIDNVAIIGLILIIQINALAILLPCLRIMQVIYKLLMLLDLLVEGGDLTLTRLSLIFHFAHDAIEDELAGYDHRFAVFQRLLPHAALWQANDVIREHDPRE